MLELQLADGHRIGMSLECLRQKSLQFDWCNNIPFNYNHFPQLHSQTLCHTVSDDHSYVRLSLGTRLGKKMLHARCIMMYNLNVGGRVGRRGGTDVTQFWRGILLIVMVCDGGGESKIALN